MFFSLGKKKFFLFLVKKRYLGLTIDEGLNFQPDKINMRLFNKNKLVPLTH